MKLYGYDFLKDEVNEGIRYAWQLNNTKHKDYVESASFYSHRKNVVDNISGYTTSVSSGCILRELQCPCRFCRTGITLPFKRLLTAKEIALQNVTMVLADMLLQQDKHTLLPKREFAYMGQGEPGYSYPQVRMAIHITNKVMETLGQSVYRHIVSTVGIPEMIFAYLADYKSGFFGSRVTLHFSLHLIDNRNSLMPINSIYSYKEVLSVLNTVCNITGEKPCVGILLFPNFSPNNVNMKFNSDINSIKKILNYLDPNKVRISFCELNTSIDIGFADEYPQEDSIKILDMAKSIGFEAKMFSSFGKKDCSACGMLGGKEPSILLTEGKYKEIENQASSLIDEVISRYIDNLA